MTSVTKIIRTETIVRTKAIGCDRRWRGGLMTLLAVAAWGLLDTARVRAGDGPDSVFEKPEPVTMTELTELARRTTRKVSAMEVNDYAPGHYTGELTPSPPQADMGDAELFNNLGRKEKNSFVDVIQSGPERVWVRWNYFAVNMKNHREFSSDFELNRWAERRVFYVLLGTARDWKDIRRIGRNWLDKGKECARPESVANLK